MRLRPLFEKQVLIRLTDDNAAFVCTAKWSVLSKITQVDCSEANVDLAPPVAEGGSGAREELPVLRPIRMGRPGPSRLVEKGLEGRLPHGRGSVSG